jgi:hypothetical protein
VREQVRGDELHLLVGLDCYARRSVVAGKRTQGRRLYWSGACTMTTPRRTRGLREAGCFERATKAERRVSQWDVGPAGSDCWQRDKYGEVFLRRTRIRYDFFFFELRLYVPNTLFLVRNTRKSASFISGS